MTINSSEVSLKMKSSFPDSGESHTASHTVILTSPSLELQLHDQRPYNVKLFCLAAFCWKILSSTIKSNYPADAVAQ